MDMNIDDRKDINIGDETVLSADVSVRVSFTIPANMEGSVVLDGDNEKTVLELLYDAIDSGDISLSYASTTGDSPEICEAVEVE